MGRGGCKMLVLKQCKCGCTRFEKEPDDDVLRCAECWSLARFSWVEDAIPDEDNDNEGGR